MIGKLRGKVDEISNDHIILDVGGVGYIVFVSSKTIANLDRNHASVSLSINMQVREDSISLYGFMHEDEKEWFLKLISVKGVGPKLALSILSSLSTDNISSVIFSKDQATLNKISGVGKKIAERIITELKDTNIVSSISNLTQQIPAKINNNLDDAVSALTNLGYNKSEIYGLCSKILQNNPDLSINDIIKLALREMSQ